MDTVDFIQQFPLRSYQKGEILLCENTVTESVFYIKKGFVKVASIVPSGNEHLLWIAAPDDIIPSEHFFSLHNTVSYNYTALSTVTAYAVKKSAWLKSARTHLPLMTTIAAGLSDSYDDLLLRLDATSQLAIHDRIVATLKYLALRFGNGKPVDLHQIGLPLTHQDIAEMIGSTRETTSLELERLRDRGALSYSHSHFVISPDKLCLA